MDYTEYARLFKALSDPKRLKIVHMLAGGELCACKILAEFHITQPTLSHDMKLLTDTGLVIPRREGKWTHYSLNKARVGEICRAAEGLMVPETGTGVCGCGKEGSKKEDMEKMETVNTKLYVLTGFLGSGKTTALLKLLERLKGSRIGVIQNEFGKLGIDGTILRNDDIQMVEINRGSIFCTCQKLNFVKALAEMAQQDFDYLFVESSGWGDPSNVQEILDAARIASEKEYDFKGVICFVDAVNFLEQVKDEETAFRQLKHCNLAVITKTDLADTVQAEQVAEKIREINPVCEIIESVNGEMDHSFLQKDLRIFQWAESEETTNSVETKPKSLFMEYQGQVEKEKLHKFLAAVAPDVHRIKGFCDLAETGWTQVDVVGSLIDYKECGAFERSQLVFISKIGPMVIKKIFSAWEEHVGSEMKLKN